MQVKHFTVRLNDSDELIADQSAVNHFLSQNITVKKQSTQFVPGAPDYWSILIFYEAAQSADVPAEVPTIPEQTNYVRLVGFIGDDVELRQFANERYLAKFSLATNEFRTDSEGTTEKIVTWHNITAWGEEAKKINSTLRKGDKVEIEGKLVYRQYETARGEKRYTTEVVLSSFRKLDTVTDPNWAPSEEDLDDEQKQLFLALKTWRKDKANDRQCPEYLIAHNATLIAIAYYGPTRYEALSRIKGMGEQKIKQYGEDIYAIVNAFTPSFNP